MWKNFFLLVLFQFSAFASQDFTEQQVIDYYEGTCNQVEDLECYTAGGFFDGVQSVLDVGCGDGQVTSRLAKQFPQVTFIGCDISKAMIGFASKKYPPSEYPNLTFIVKDASHLDDHEAFDRIVSFSALHWISDQKQALSSIYKALKPQGKALIRATPKSSHNDFKAMSLKVILSFKWVSHFINFKSSSSFHSERDYRKILSDIGFKIDRMEQKNSELFFANRAELMPFLKAILTPLSHLPTTKHNDFLQDYYDQLVKHGNQNKKGEIRIHFDKIELLLSKNCREPS
jgi:trans-aconitate 2-methyltransferase